MLIIRLTRTGKKNAPRFRIVLVEKTAPPKTGKFLEILGSYNPESKEIILKKEQIKYWLSQGVQTSETVHNILVSNDVIKGPKIKKKIRDKKKSPDSKAIEEPQSEASGKKNTETAEAVPKQDQSPEPKDVEKEKVDKSKKKE